MTEQEVDRRCAIYGTLLGIFVAAVIVALFWWVVETATAFIQTDGSAPSTCITILESDLPGAFMHPTREDCIEHADTWHEAKLIETHPASFRHFFWASGPRAAIFQVDIVETDGAGRHWANPSGCRTCDSRHTQASGQACAYWSMGYNIVVASGQSCAAYGVPPCEGSLCR